MINKAQRFWDKQAKKFDFSEKRFESISRILIAETKKYLDSNDIVLDFGCATGTKTLYLASATKHIQGLDFSSEMINLAIKKKNEANILNCSFMQGTIFNDDIEKESFDKIISYSVIHLLEDYEKQISRIYELLKPGGLFISTTACFKDKMALKNKIEFIIFHFLKRLGIFPLHLNMFKNDDVEKLFKDQNFQIVKAEKIFQGISASFIVAKKS